MKFRSTRDREPSGSTKISLEDAIVQGLAPDGGLYVPVAFPKVETAGETLVEIATDIFAAFGSADIDWSTIAASAFDFPTPVVALPPNRVLELFHGPTAAFKDYGARFLARVLSAVSQRDSKRRTVLVATSGDTGGAVASAFFEVPLIDVVILYPQGRISKRQETQLTCWGGNVSAYAIRGSFDDCQRIVKAAFNDAALRSQHGLTSANSINIGRLIPQMCYYAYASTFENRASDLRHFCVPTGNLGNALACVWSKKCGFPIGTIQLATNANETLPRFFDSGSYDGTDAISTHANAMDVGDPSNFERLQHLLVTSDEMKKFGLTATSVSDETIETTIADTFKKHGYVLDPHTACAVSIADVDAIVVATAHPAKFESVVEPIVGPVEIPELLAKSLERETSVETIDANLEELRKRLP